jgi:hypothetical protein
VFKKIILTSFLVFISLTTQAISLDLSKEDTFSLVKAIKNIEKSIDSKKIQSMKEKIKGDITEIDLSNHGNNVNDVFCSILFRVFPNLEKLNLNNCTLISNTTLWLIEAYYPHLKSLSLSGSYDSETLSYLKKINPNIVLEISKFEDIQKENDDTNKEYSYTWNEIKEKFPFDYNSDLKELDFSPYQKDANDVTCDTIFRIFSNVEKINLNNCILITEKTLENIAKYYPKLKYLSLNSLKLKPKNFELLYKLNDLQYLDISSTTFDQLLDIDLLKLMRLMKRS